MPGNTYTKQALQKMNTRHRLMLYMIASGYSNKEVAQSVGLSATRVSAIKNSPLFLAELGKLENEIRSRFVDNQVAKRSFADKAEEHADKALEFLGDMIDDSTEVGKPTPRAIQYKAAKDIIEIADRWPGKGSDKYKGRGGGGNGRGGTIDIQAQVLEAGYKEALANREAAKDRRLGSVRDETERVLVQDGVLTTEVETDGEAHAV